MKAEKISFKKLKELQYKVDEFIKKGHYPFKYVLIAGAIVAAIPILTLVGCHQEFDSNIDDPKYQDSIIVHTNSSISTNLEQSFEEALASYLQQETGLEINLVNMKKVDLITKDNKYYLVIDGEMITDIEQGRKESVITLNISESQARLAIRYLQNAFHVIRDEKGGYVTLNNDDNAIFRYSEEFILGMSEIIKDQDTQIENIYIKNNQEMIYSKSR